MSCFARISNRRGVHALHQRRRRPEPQRDLLELPALAEIADREVELPAVGIGVEQAAVLGGEEFARRHELLLREQRRHQAGKRAAALVEFHRRRAPGREGAGGLAAREPEGARHGVGVEAAQPAHRRGGAERPEHARPVPAALPEFRIVEPVADPRRDLAAGGDGDEQVAAGIAVLVGDRQRRRDHLRRDVGHGRAVHVAHGRGRDQIAVQQRRAGEREPAAADDTGLAGLRERGRQRGHLMGFLALVAGEGAGQRVEQEVLAMLPHALRHVVIAKRGRELRQHSGCVAWHSNLPRCGVVDAILRRNSALSTLAPIIAHDLQSCQPLQNRPTEETRVLRNRQEQPRTAVQSVQVLRGAAADRLGLDREPRRHRQPRAVQHVQPAQLRSAVRVLLGLATAPTPGSARIRSPMRRRPASSWSTWRPTNCARRSA